MSCYTKSQNKAERVALLEDFDSDDDFFLKGPSTTSDKVKRVQNQVNEVVGVMKDNIGKVMDRGDKLEDLQDKSESLSDGASTFNARAGRLRKQMWWKNVRIKLFIGFAVLLILIIIILSVSLKKKSNDGS